MTTTRQGINTHEAVELLERATMRLDAMEIAPEQTERIGLLSTFLALGFTPGQAAAAVERISPATRPAGEPESPAHDQEPKRQA